MQVKRKWKQVVEVQRCSVVSAESVSGGDRQPATCGVFLLFISEKYPIVGYILIHVLSHLSRKVDVVYQCNI